MRDLYLHERLYRNKLFVRRKDYKITICGAGALGSNLAENLARQGFSNLKVIDYDRIEKHNLGNQVYTSAHIGNKKVHALKSIIYSIIGQAIGIEDRKLLASNAKQFLKNSDLIIDTFDDVSSRKIVKEMSAELKIPCIHAGMAADFCHVQSNEGYIVPKDNPDEEDICDYPMAKNLVSFTVSILSEAICQYLEDGKRNINYHFTLKDLLISDLMVNKMENK